MIGLKAEGGLQPGKTLLVEPIRDVAQRGAFGDAGHDLQNILRGRRQRLRRLVGLSGRHCIGVHYFLPPLAACQWLSSLSDGGFLRLGALAASIAFRLASAARSILRSTSSRLSRLAAMSCSNRRKAC